MLNPHCHSLPTHNGPTAFKRGTPLPHVSLDTNTITLLTSHRKIINFFFFFLTSTIAPRYKPPPPTPPHPKLCFFFFFFFFFFFTNRQCTAGAEYGALPKSTYCDLATRQPTCNEKKKPTRCTNN